MNDKDLNTAETVDSQEQNELITEFCASEKILGSGSGLTEGMGIYRY